MRAQAPTLPRRPPCASTTSQHRFYCGIDLHARTCTSASSTQDGNVVCDRNLACRPDAFLHASLPSATASSSASSACSPGTGSPTSVPHEHIPFVLGHALYMKAIHGGKTKNDDIDADKIARLLRGGNFPLPTSIPRACAKPATCSAAAITSSTNAPSSSLTSRSPTASTTCPLHQEAHPSPPTAPNSTSPSASPTRSVQQSAAAQPGPHRCPRRTRSPGWNCT